MAVTAKFTETFSIVVTEDALSRIRAIADREGISMAQVARELIDASLPEREAQSLEVAE